MSPCLGLIGWFLHDNLILIRVKVRIRDLYRLKKGELAPCAFQVAKKEIALMTI